MTSQNKESLSGGIHKSGQDQYSAVGKIANAPRSDLAISDLTRPTGNQNFSAGQYANILQGNTHSREEESEMDFGEGERLGESYAQALMHSDPETRDQNARRSLVDEEASFGPQTLSSKETPSQLKS
jgi:hypothetical protein